MNVQGPRAQIDRKLYKHHMQLALNSYPNLDVRAASVHDLVFDHPASESTWGTVSGVRLGTYVYNSKTLSADFSLSESGEIVRCSQVVICTGTFLSGEIHIGEKTFPAGRINEAPSVGLSGSLRSAGFKLGRLQTGTPARLDKTSIDWSDPRFEVQPGDEEPAPFSFMSNKVDNAVRLN